LKRRTRNDPGGHRFVERNWRLDRLARELPGAGYVEANVAGRRRAEVGAAAGG
jgi:hypothetical protein